MGVFFIVSYNNLGDNMKFKKGDLVTRISYEHDLVFKIVDYKKDQYILRGLNIRLYADSKEADLVLLTADKEVIENDDEIAACLDDYLKMERDQYFYLPGKILHIDGDKEYLSRCLNFYKKANILAYGVHLNEGDIPKKLEGYLERVSPDIVIITGHDAYYTNEFESVKNYKNSNNFIKAVKKARSYEKAHDKLIIIAGACQSNYEELIKAGANFASSPRRINIHALDPAIIASIISLSDHSEDIDLIGILEKTKYGAQGIGGIKTKGTMYIGYPR